MPYILIDTCVFIRLKGIYKETLDCILAVCDKIACTKDIMDEYEGRAHSSPLFHLKPFLQELENNGKLKFFPKSFVDSRLRRQENVRRINYPTHEPDKKWIKVAIAIRAKYILSTNRHLLEIASNQNNGDIIEIITPSRYTGMCCP